MKTTYTKCHHGNELRFGCNKCDQERNMFYKGFTNDKLGQPKDKRIPILRGCGVEPDETPPPDSDDISLIDKQYKSPEETIQEYEKIIHQYAKEVLRLTEENKRLKEGLYGHLKTSHVTNY